MEKILIKIDGMSCHHCKMSVEKVLSQIKEVTSYTVDIEKGQAEITGNFDIATVIDEINNLGYHATLAK